MRVTMRVTMLVSLTVGMTMRVSVTVVAVVMRVGVGDAVSVVVSVSRPILIFEAGQHFQPCMPQIALLFRSENNQHIKIRFWDLQLQTRRLGFCHVVNRLHCRQPQLRDHLTTFDELQALKATVQRYLAHVELRRLASRCEPANHWRPANHPLDNRVQ